MSGVTNSTFNIKGMDCAACTTKIETAVKRVKGTSDVRVGLQSQTLTVSLASLEDGQKVEQAVRDLGYEIAPKPAKGASAQLAAPSHAEGDGHDHSDHGEPIEGPWWETSKGLLVIVTGIMIGLAYLERNLLPFGSSLVFYAATFIGTYPVAKRAFAGFASRSM